MTDANKPTIRQQMDEDFQAIRALSLELQSLIRQGVRKDIDDKLQQRDQMLRDWFGRVSELITITQEQEAFLQQMLVEERQLVNLLEQEQKDLAGQKKKHKNVKHYRSMGGH
ncbi:hypothetical protein [Oceanobacter mangrovi]|uniref:hypothetical protein n=1 Tax=Oceanobacter mangrovi TaxID=2862510 RepID=UPI001C8D309C|nr:hypothetical protein [Oceanobacter mangrovi]